MFTPIFRFWTKFLPHIFQNEDEPRKDRKGRPLLSIKDKINGALSGGSVSIALLGVVTYVC